MTSPAFAAHRAAASGLFTLTSLLVIALGSADPRAVAAAIAVSLVSLWLFTRGAVRDWLGSFAAPLAMLVDQAVLVAAIALTEGARSPYALLFPTGLALAWAFEGRAAARFLAAVSLLAVGALALLGIVSLEDPATRVPLAAMALAAPALLAALEAGAGRHASEGRAAAPVPGRGTAEARDQDAGILHDLRSPLSVMRVYADLIAEGARRGQLPNPEHLSNLKREIELAEGLVGGPAESPERAGERSEREPQNRSPGPAAAVPPAGPPPIADLVEILGSLATAYRLSLAGNRRIEFIAERPQLPVTAEPVALQRAFRNVIENAIKYTTEGGEIRIRAGAAGPHAFVVVKDTGIGMSPEERQRAFDYAFRGSGAVASGKPGKGLGLALTKEILEANGGRISLSSEAGFGSEVTILLPYQRGPRV